MIKYIPSLRAQLNLYQNPNKIVIKCMEVPKSGIQKSF